MPADHADDRFLSGPSGNLRAGADVNTIAEIRARSSGDPRAGSLGRRDLESFARILDAHGRGVLLVTGAGDGPLSLSTGLAAASAARGTRTALLECDLASPALAGALGLEEGPGLGEYIRGETESRRILQSLVLAGPASAGATAPLICIVAGAPDDAGPLDAGAFRHALEKLRHAYELVVVQGPPLADESGILREAATSADGVLACVGPQLLAGRSGRKLGKVLKRLPASLAGVVAYGAAG
jgi:Mrp family chromosome partitioning ATPase